MPSYQGKTLSEWIALTKDKDEKVRSEAAWALVRIGSEAKSAIPALTELLKDKDGLVRWAAIETLGKIGPEAKTAVPALTELLKDRDDNVQWAAKSLGMIGPDAKAAVPALTELLKDKDVDVRWSAVMALGSIGSETKNAIPTRRVFGTSSANAGAVMARTSKDKMARRNIIRTPVQALPLNGPARQQI